MKKSVLIAVLLSLILPGIIFAGGGKESGGDNYIRLTWWGNTVRDERTLKVAELYKSKNPGVVIDTETTGWGGYWDKVNTQAASGSVPDIMQQDFAYIGQWASRNQLADLTPYINQGIIDVSKISESALSSGKIDGKLYGISMGTNAFGITYDPAILRQAGISGIDSKKWTWKDFESIATTIYEKTGVRTLPFSTVDPLVLFENFIRQTGASVYTPDGKKLGFTETNTLKEFWDIQLRLLDKGVLLPPDEAFITVSIEEDPFSKGKSWVQYIWSNQVTATANGIGKPIEMAFCPRIDGYKRPGTYLKPSQFFSITAKAENPELAAKVLNFYVNDLEANDILLAERGVPIPDNVRDYLYPKMDATQKIAFTFISEAGDYTSPIDPPDPAAAGEIRAIFRDITVQVLNKTITSQEGANRFQTRANQLLGGK